MKKSNQRRSRKLAKRRAQHEREERLAVREAEEQREAVRQRAAYRSYGLGPEFAPRPTPALNTPPPLSIEDMEKELVTDRNPWMPPPLRGLPSHYRLPPVMAAAMGVAAAMGTLGNPVPRPMRDITEEAEEVKPEAIEDRKDSCDDG